MLINNNNKTLISHFTKRNNSERKSVTQFRMNRRPYASVLDFSFYTLCRTRQCSNQWINPPSKVDRRTTGHPFLSVLCEFTRLRFVHTGNVRFNISLFFSFNFYLPFTINSAFTRIRYETFGSVYSRGMNAESDHFYSLHQSIVFTYFHRLIYGWCARLVSVGSALLKWPISAQQRTSYRILILNANTTSVRT